MSDPSRTVGEEWGRLSWSQWIPLDASAAGYRTVVPNQPGLYRVRGEGLRGLVYIGQTGRFLRERIRALAAGVYRSKNDPPWNDPHTAAPALWAFRHEDGISFEISIAVCEVDVQKRQCWEDMLLYLHRRELGESTFCNHGRMHPWWTRPRNRKTKVAAIRREQPVVYESLRPSVGGSDSSAADWLGLRWSTPTAITDAVGPVVGGVYRIMTAGGSVVYIGEASQLRTRIASHAKDSRFGNEFVSWYGMPNLPKHQLHEQETDLIGAYFEEHVTAPTYQYRPKG